MRQDKRFQPGEGVTSRYFADWVSDTYDWLITVDPHIHRYDGLGDIYEIETAVCQAKRMVGEWVREKVKDPVILGPDSESKQWVGAVAGELDIPYTVLEKTRRGDRDVVVSVPDPELLEGRQPVILDDIISTGRTMIETIGHLNDFGTESPICVGIHGIFSGNTGEQLMEAGAKKVVTTNSIPHQTNEIDLTPVIRQGLSDYGFV
jgi:ribose-phosphate pyrophosphokinase